MARKNKRQQPRKPQRGRQGPGPARPAGAPPPLTRPGAAPAPGPAAPAAPAVAARPARSSGTRGSIGPASSQTAAIPLDRVPYFRSDLRRIAITGLVMVVILIGGAQLIH
ncbi:MAG TPA: hypothetical protein VET65_00820 [Candidatus Limnocylindrales bacterium]|nr:hypothetical protein [Candidatus Limnocylindrales bacterium]